MAISAKQVANWFYERAQKEGKAPTVMSLLKWTYIAHGWHLEVFSEPLFSDEIQAWQYGPVIPSVYKAFRKQENGQTPKSPIKCDAIEFDDEVVRLLEEVWNKYSKFSAAQLSRITHEKDGPWDRATNIGGYYATIPNELIHAHYVEKRAQSEKSGANIGG